MAIGSPESTAPFSASNGTAGVLVLHGFTASPVTVRSLAEALADASFSVEAPLLPGHGTTPHDLERTSFDEWSAAAEDAYLSLQARTDRVAVAGLSMGGTLSLWLAQRHPRIAALVLINPFVEPLDSERVTKLRADVAAGREMYPSPGSDIAREGADGGSYDETPVRALLSLLESTDDVVRDLGRVTCPVLLFSSRADHVVPSTSSERVERAVSGPLERVMLERSFHVATLDHDGAEIEQRSVAFLQKVLDA